MNKYLFFSEYIELLSKQEAGVEVRMEERVRELVEREELNKLKLIMSE